MNQEQLQGKWNVLKGEIKTKWGSLTDNDLQQIGGNFDKLVGKIQEKYGKSKEEAQREVNEWQSSNQD